MARWRPAQTCSTSRSTSPTATSSSSGSASWSSSRAASESDRGGQVVHLHVALTDGGVQQPHDLVQGLRVLHLGDERGGDRVGGLLQVRVAHFGQLRGGGDR